MKIEIEVSEDACRDLHSIAESRASDWKASAAHSIGQESRDKAMRCHAVWQQIFDQTKRQH